ncbi:MAG: multidrug ABC transporter substrate-binding protein [Candidatus Melainabacteria bacterium HGW-Melainabacteria-1]|nr:MAG: multidrug ABC transporter substrate-binding protein [Candidatus Melainabacteria bacterium HGW-Melainabacteria-1]
MDRYFRMAFEALVLNKVRSFLTTLGIIIGVFSVIVMIGLGQASQSYITDQIKGLGAGVLIITPGNPKMSSTGPPGVNTAKTVDLDDAAAIENLPGIAYVSPNVFLQLTMKFERHSVPAAVLGTNPNVLEARGLKVGQGRFFTEQEARSGTQVIVLGKSLAETLFDRTLSEPLGSKVRINNQRYRVIGILAEQGSGIFGSVDDQAFMPTKTFQQTLKSGKGLNSLIIKVQREQLLPLVSDQARNLLRYRHALRPDEEDDFRIQTQAELLSTVSTVTQVFTFLLAGIAAISLVVGGIGIMNIMLVSVTERTREIGVRKALGATRRAILIQFLIEAATLSLTGGAVGIGLGLLVTKIATQAVNLPFVFSLAAVIGAFAFSAFVGIFFGIYPANKASRLDPVDALRYE